MRKKGGKKKGGRKEGKWKGLEGSGRGGDQREGVQRGGNDEKESSGRPRRAGEAMIWGIRCVKKRGVAVTEAKQLLNGISEWNKFMGGT